MKTKTKKIIAGSLFAGVLATGFFLVSGGEDMPVSAPVAEQPVVNKPITKIPRSYITVPTYDTPTGELAEGDYALINGGYVTYNDRGELQWFEGSPPSRGREVQETGFKRQTKFRDGTKVDISEGEYKKLKDNLKI